MIIENVEKYRMPVFFYILDMYVCGGFMFIKREFVFLILFAVIFVVMNMLYMQTVSAQEIAIDLSDAVSSRVSSSDVSSFFESMIDIVKSAFWTAVQIVINAFNNYAVPFLKKYPVAMIPLCFLVFWRFFLRR